jgi:hypothetical protein
MIGPPTWRGGLLAAETKQCTTSGRNSGALTSRQIGRRSMLTFQIIGAALLLLCLVPLLARDPQMRRSR